MISAKTKCLFINPRDLIGASPFTKSAECAGVLLDKGFPCEVVEPAASALSNEQIATYAKNYHFSILILSVFPSGLPDAHDLIRRLKKQMPSSTIVLTGYHVNAEPQIVNEIGADFGITGDVEYSLLELVEHLRLKKSIPDDLPGLVQVKDGKVISNVHAFIEDLNELPLPAYHLLPVGKYFSASTNRQYMTLFTARGCPYKCSFCANPSQMRYRYLSTDNVMRHLHVLINELKVEFVEFMDLTFTVNRKRTTDLCNAIIESGMRFQWACETRVDCLNEELIILMKQAGCNKITFGIESGSERVRFSTGKRIPDAQFFEIFNLCRKHGIHTMANFILGSPGETMEEARQSVKMARELKAFNVLFTRLIPLPDISLFEEGVKAGLIKKDVWINYMRNGGDLPVYYPGPMSSSEVNTVYKEAYLRFYWSPRVLINYLPLFLKPTYFFQSIQIFLKLTFGSPKFK